jgi:hypothetical protein
MLVHAPALQTWPAAQTAPQAPQFMGSSRVDTQTPPQSVLPAAQAHVPATQDVPPAQTTPQPPQLRPSVFVLTQAPPHAVSPARHVARQRPSEQT